MAQLKKPKPGEKVVLIGLPPKFLEDLPAKDKRAISKRVGTQIKLKAYDELGRAELEFREAKGIYHVIWVAPSFVRPVKRRVG